MNRPRRVAIVGAGPRAAYALERLATLARRHGRTAPTTDVYGPGDAVGPGEVYDPAQPRWLRLNVASAAVDAWRANLDDEPGGPSFDQWRERQAPGSTRDQFPARALAGRYLAQFGAEVRAQVPGDRVDRRVTSLRRVDDGWLIDHRSYDAVLLALGHARDWPGALRRQWPTEAPRLVPGVFPVSRLRAAVPDEPGGTVIVRGAALTAIDAALALTRDRRHPRPLILTSRTGKLMTPKTEPDVLRALLDLDAVTAPGRAALRDPNADVTDVLMRTAQQVHAAALGRPAGAHSAEAVVAAAADMLLPNKMPDPAQWLRGQVRMASGQVPIDGSWALGQAWRALAPALVSRQEALRGRVRWPLGWPGYRRWAPELERLAFGPPLTNARALLELMDARLLRVEQLSARPGALAGVAIARRAAAVVDAVLPPPGLADVTDPLLAELAAAGWIRVGSEGRGLAVGPAAECLSSTGEPTPGLAAVGRVTEDVVLGNDTLIRTMHPHLDRWARAVLDLPTAHLAAEVAHGYAG